MTKVSTSALAKSKDVTSKDLFSHLQKQGLLARAENEWILTKEGEACGGEYKESSKFGKYIVWPETIDVIALDESDEDKSARLITAKTIASHFDISAKQINFVLSELGWLKKGLKGWLATEQAIVHGGIQTEDRKSGIPFVRWPDSILEKKSLIDSIDQIKGKSSYTESNTSQDDSKPEKNFREKFQAKHRSTDGHFVRSKAEMLIDNWLYMAEIVHAYERKLPIEEDVYCDFYIPTGKIYIEYWGYDVDQKYLARKKKKIEIYKKYGFNLIELQDEDVQNLDDILPRLLLKYGVQAY